ncbi:MAG TPA: hypothetical protein VGP44_05230 [Gemmatimonadales bacterium]|nr:hypothetical protein [Gemmatimonadales bacterium]
MSGRRLAAVIFFLAAITWGVLLGPAIHGPEAHAAREWRTVAFVVMIVAGSLAFPRRRP